VPFIFYDTETTGTRTSFDQILQFAAIRVIRQSYFRAVGLVSEFSDLKRIEMKNPGARPGTGTRRGFHRRDDLATRHLRCAPSQLRSVSATV
jgi:hypothetical protein